MRPSYVRDIIFHGKSIDETKFMTFKEPPIRHNIEIPFITSTLQIKHILSDNLNQIQKEYINEIVFYHSIIISGQALISYFNDSGNLVTEWFPPISTLSNLKEFDYIDTFSLEFYFHMHNPDIIVLVLRTKCSIWGYLTPDSDNSELAKINNPHLIHFLQEIEQIFGTPIHEWEGEMGMKVGHYGFLPDSLEERQSQKKKIKQ